MVKLQEIFLEIRGKSRGHSENNTIRVENILNYTLIP